MHTHYKIKTMHHNLKALLFTPHPIMPITLDPISYTQVSKSQHGRDVIAKGFDALAHNNTRLLVPISKVSNIVGWKWVFKIKRKSYGSVERYKVRFFAKGYTQKKA
jgi:hypothetical protein